MLGTLFDLALVLAGFSSIILIHELGHFLAARWAGIRVMAFAMGFGPALVSYRKGMGVRGGSTEAEYLRVLKADPQGVKARGLSATEYRWNLLPLGGYVKMLGQDDADPGAVSNEPDSFQSAPVWKRMVVISAGVIFNVILAALLFVVVFSRGLLVERPVVGDVLPGGPAATVMATNAADLGVAEAGLQGGDEVLAVNGRAVPSFHRLVVEAALAQKGGKIDLDVRRDGVNGTLRFAIEPKEDAGTRRLDLGIAPAVSPVLRGGAADSLSQSAAAEMTRRLTAMGLPGVRPGMRLVAVSGSAGSSENPGDAAVSVYAMDRAANRGGGTPVRVEFATASGDRVGGELVPRPEVEVAAFTPPGAKEGQVLTTPHLLGLTPVMRVEQVTPEGEATGLKPGDIFARLGDLAWPNPAEGIAEIRRGERTSIPVVVSRLDTGGDTATLADLGEVKVVKGRIGFIASHSTFESNVLGRWPQLARANLAGLTGQTNVALTNAPAFPPGTRLLAVGEQAVRTLGDAREALRAALGRAVPESDGARIVSLGVELPASAGESPATIVVPWKVDTAAQSRLAALRWLSPLNASFFEPDQKLQRGEGALDSIAIGIDETKYAMLSTYLTLARLVQGSVKVEHLNGPVGIAHVGTILADRGLIWLLFFMAVVSVNLAVINFLPMPIVDGGHMVYLLYEQFTGKRVSVVVQNVATIAGLALIGTCFLVVTYNDLARLLWR
ncbi:MAG: site-2 protease family protein [Phycisphaerales bacterium]